MSSRLDLDSQAELRGVLNDTKVQLVMPKHLALPAPPFQCKALLFTDVCIVQICIYSSKSPLAAPLVLHPLSLKGSLQMNFECTTTELRCDSLLHL